jgi:hypothetical protein
MKSDLVNLLALFRESRQDNKSTTRFLELLEKVFKSDFIDRPDITPEGFIKYYRLQAQESEPYQSRMVLTLNEFEIHKVLKEIAETAYPEKEIRFFKININAQESRTKHGDYNILTKEIRIYNLSRKTAHIIKTTIHELAHHCQNCFEGNTGHDKQFYEIYKHLLETAHRIGFIDLSKTLDEIDSRDLKVLVKTCGNLNFKKIEKKDTNIIKVINSFDYKIILKDRGYSYSSTEKAWVKEVETDMTEAEQTYLVENCPKAKIVIVSQNDYTIDSVYYMLVGKNVSGFDMKKEGFFFHERYGWTKKIQAAQKDSEEQKCMRKFRIKPKFSGTL